MKNYPVLYFAIGIIVFAIIIGLTVLLYNRKKETNGKRINVDEKFIDELINLYGGSTNIKSVEVENSRLKVTVLDIYSVNLEGLKGLSSSGVFITSQTIKTLYKFDSELIKKSIEERI